MDKPMNRPDIEHKIRFDLVVNIHPEEVGGYSASVRGLPGCYSEGETLAEVRRNIREAIECHLGLPDGPARASAKPPTKAMANAPAKARPKRKAGSPAR